VAMRFPGYFRIDASLIGDDRLAMFARSENLRNVQPGPASRREPRQRRTSAGTIADVSRISHSRIEPEIVIARLVASAHYFFRFRTEMDSLRAAAISVSLVRKCAGCGMCDCCPNQA
jgi:hypothetical protein